MAIFGTLHHKLGNGTQGEPRIALQYRLSEGRTIKRDGGQLTPTISLYHIYSLSKLEQFIQKELTKLPLFSTHIARTVSASLSHHLQLPCLLTNNL